MESFQPDLFILTSYEPTSFLCLWEQINGSFTQLTFNDIHWASGHVKVSSSHIPSNPFHHCNEPFHFFYWEVWKQFFVCDKCVCLELISESMWVNMVQLCLHKRHLTARLQLIWRQQIWALSTGASMHDTHKHINTYTCTIAAWQQLLMDNLICSECKQLSSQIFHERPCV